MKHPILHLMASLGLIAAVSSARGQTVYGVEAGTTSISLNSGAVASFGYTVTGSDPTAVPLGGLDLGFNILSATTDFRFTLDTPGIVIEGGVVGHSGSIDLTAGGTTVQIGNFEIGFDPARESATTSGAFVRDALTTDAVVFDIAAAPPGLVNPVSDGETVTLGTADLLVSPELFLLLGSPAGGASGDFVGNIRIDGLAAAVPEPSTGLLTVVGGALLVFRRRRPSDSKQRLGFGLTV